MPLLVEDERGQSSDGGAGGRSKKRKLGYGPIEKKRKLLEGEEVEVRFSDEGLKGSWHRGLVIGCEKCLRHVEYYDICKEENSSKLVEPITVSSAIEGLTTKIPNNSRGNIRPLPPHHSVDRYEIRYGMCVDALVNDAWWEGVIFDHDENLLSRIVLFPDQGDQHVISVDNMRLTFDWNEVLGDWKRRDSWTLLMLLEDLEKEEAFPISIREIWYDVASSVAFHEKIGEWIFGSWSAWYELVSEVIKEALAVVQSQDAAEIVPFTSTVNSSLNCDDIHIPEDFTFLEDAVLPEDDAQLSIVDRTFFTKCAEGPSHRRYIHAAGDDCNLETPIERGNTFSEPYEDVSVLKQGCEAVLDFIAKRRSCSAPRPSAVMRRYKVTRELAKRHLLAVGWKFMNGSRYKYYVSPGGEQFYSFIKACEAWASAEDADKVNGGSSKNSTSCDKFAEEKCKLANGSDKYLVTDFEMESWKPVHIEAEFCTESVVNCACCLDGGKLEPRRVKQTEFNCLTARLQLKKHLVALGWKIDGKTYGYKGMIRQRFRYCSPDGKVFYSLLNTCRYLLEEQKVKKCPLSEDYDARQENLSSEYLCIENPVSDAHEQKVITSKDLAPENFPDAILDYVNYMELKNTVQTPDISSEAVKQKILKAKKHLLFLGWRLWLKPKNGRHELQYNSPNKKCFSSLYTACKACLKKNKIVDDAALVKIAEEAFKIKKLENMSVKHNSSSRGQVCTSTSVACNMPQESVHPSDKTKKASTFSSDLPEFGKLGFCKSQKRVGKISKRIKDTLSSPSSLADLHDSVQSCSYDDDTIWKFKKKASRSLPKHGGESCNSKSRTVLRPCKRAKQVHVSSPSQHKPRTVLSWLVDNDVLLPRQKVRYVHKIDGHILMEGLITRDGIKCKCCKKVYSLSHFEIHAGSTNHHPAANIFLKDGRCLSECLIQMLDRNKHNHLPQRRIKGDYSIYNSDTVCSMCQEGGRLLLCDHCPSSFHLNCVGLEDLPEGKWFCPSCLCRICGLSEFNSDIKKFTDKTKLYCDQCEGEYHVGCLQKDGLAVLTSCPEGYWFCSKSCSEIFYCLRDLLGRSNPTSVEGFSWTILRSSKENDYDIDRFDIETRAEHHSKLCVALDVLHECFVTIIEPRTKRDLVEDLLFNKESELNRLNFGGFYTMLLEKGDELISVVTFRVYGSKAAEMPLVGTRIQYRRKGMCHLLIDELEKLLLSLGVERLLLPAVPQLLETWTTSFGFTKMMHSERLKLSEFTFLNFQSTTMCQKTLKSPMTVLDKYRGHINALSDRSNMNNDVGCDSLSIISETVQEVSPLDTLQSAVSECLTIDDDKVSLQSDAAICSPISNCLDPLVLVQEEKESLQSQLADQILVNLAPGQLENNCVSIETTPEAIKMKSVIDKRKGEHDEPTFKTGKENCLSKGSDAKSSGFFKYFYKRRILMVTST